MRNGFKFSNEIDIKSENKTLIEVEATPSTLYFLKQRTILVNLCIMIFIWITVVFNFYLIMFLVNSFRASNICGVAISISEITANCISGLFYEKFGAKIALSRSFAISTIAGILILAYGLDH